MKLLESYQLQDLSLQNRLVVAPMTRSRAYDSIPTDLIVEYYAQRASAGLIVTEATNVSAQAIGGPYTPGIYTQAQIDGWKRVTEAVHARGAKIFVQLWHTGRASHSYFHGGDLPVAPSAVAIKGKIFTPEGMKDYETPRELSVSEIEQIVEDYAQATRNAQEAGFDGVELHASFGYLPNQFLSDASNHRTDQYGGSVENRSRFVIEIMEKLCAIWPQRVGIRLAPSNQYNDVLDSNPPAIYDYLIQKLNDFPLAYLSLQETLAKEHPNTNYIFDVTQRYRPLFEGVVITNTGLTKDTGEAMLENNLADLVAYGLLYIANPDLAERFAQNAPLNEPLPNRKGFYGGNHEGFTDYPFL
jgi:N-ethylmaleimide reductase